MLAEAIREQLDINVDRKKIDLGNAIKTAGKHEFTVTVYRDIKATLEVNVVSDGTAIEIVEAEEELPAEEGTEEAEVVTETVEEAE